MANLFLDDVSYHESVRRKLGTTSVIITDGDIDDITCLGIAENIISMRVPDYQSITLEKDLLYLKTAAINYMAALLCPVMKIKHKTEVKTIDTAWVKGDIDWDKQAETYMEECNFYLGQIQSVIVDGGVEVNIFGLAKSARRVENETGTV
jgi:hypothetical protein